MEIGSDQGPAVRALFEGAGYREVALQRDYGGLDRVVSGGHGHGGSARLSEPWQRHSETVAAARAEAVVVRPGPAGLDVGERARRGVQVVRCCLAHRRRRAGQPASACRRCQVRVLASTKPPRERLLLYLGERRGRVVPTCDLPPRRADAAVSAGAATSLLLVRSSSQIEVVGAFRFEAW